MTSSSILSDAIGASSQPRSAELKQEEVDVEELKLGREADYMADVIRQRQEDLDNVETLMNDVNAIAKQINVNVHKQRTDLEQIDKNAGEALDNAVAAHENVEEAQKHQKKGGKIMCYIVSGILIFVAIILLILFLTLRNK